jgi:hypothetical protein
MVRRRRRQFPFEAFGAFPDAGFGLATATHAEPDVPGEKQLADAKDEAPTVEIALNSANCSA